MGDRNLLFYINKVALTIELNVLKREEIIENELPHTM